MSTLAEKLHKWSLRELNLVSEGGASRIPDINSFSSLTKGKSKRIWNYVVNHVRSQSAVQTIKRTLYIKKILREKEDNVLPSSDNSVELEKLQLAVSRAAEKRAYLMRTMSTIEERLLNLEQKNKSTKDKTFIINQKAAVLELLNQQLTEKNLRVKNLYSEISCLKNELTAYESAKTCDKTLMTEPYDIISSMMNSYTESVSGIKDLLNIVALYKKNFNERQEISDTLSKQVSKTTNEPNRNDILLTDLVILLKKISVSDLQYITDTILQDLSSKEIAMHEKKRDSAKALARLKCDIVYNSVSAVKNRKQTEKHLIIKENIFKAKIKGAQLEPNGVEFDTICTLVEKVAENEALIMSNNYIDNYLKNLSKKTDIILGNLHNQKHRYAELSSVLQKFYDNSSLTYYLIHTASDAFQQVLCDLNNLQLFAYENMFISPLPEKECLEKLNMSLISDRIESLNYCEKANLIKLSFTEPCMNNYPLSFEILKSLSLQPYENISFLCENWTHLKQKLQTKVVAYSEAFVENRSVNVSEMYTDFIKMLEKMKFSIENGLLFISEGTLLCDKTKSEIQEWWEQNAQYIPHIEYEGKTLKMWIDILSVLSNSEPQDYNQK